MGAVAVYQEAVERERIANAESDGGGEAVLRTRLRDPVAWEAVRDATMDGMVKEAFQPLDPDGQFFK